MHLKYIIPNEFKVINKLLQTKLLAVCADVFMFELEFSGWLISGDPVGYHYFYSGTSEVTCGVICCLINQTCSRIQAKTIQYTITGAVLCPHRAPRHLISS